MATVTSRRKVEFQGVFDTQAILSSIDSLQKKLNGIKLNDSSLKTFEKSFLDLKKKTQEIEAQIKQGFSNSNQITSFDNNLQKLSQRMEILRGEISRIDTSFNNLQLNPKVQKQFESLKTSLDQIFNNYGNQISTIEQKISSLAEKTKVSLGEGESLNLAKAISSEEELSRLQEEKVNSLREERAETEKNIKKKEEELAIAQQILEERQTQYKTAYTKYDESASTSQQILSQEGRSTNYRNALETQKKLHYVSEDTRKSFQDQQKAVNKINKAIKDEKESLEETENSLANIQKFFQTISGNSSGLDEDASAAATEFSNLNNRIVQLETELEKATSQLREFKNLQSQKVASNLGASSKEIGTYVTNLDKASAATDELRGSLSNLQSQNQFFENLKSRAADIFGLTNAFIYMNRFIRESVEVIKELDAAFTEIAVVTNMTTEQLWESFDSYNEMAQKLGTTTVDAIKTSALYYQQGLETAEVMALTKETIKMARIAGMDFAEATDRELKSYAA